MKGLSSEISKYMESYEDKIKVFYLKFKYYLKPDINKCVFSFFTDKEKIAYNNCSNNSGKLSELHLPKHSIEGFFIQGNKDCNLSFSLEPYINNMEVSIKKNEKYFLLIKKCDLLVRLYKLKNIYKIISLFPKNFIRTKTYLPF